MTYNVHFDMYGKKSQAATQAVHTLYSYLDCIQKAEFVQSLSS